MPIRIQRKRTKGWRMPPNTVSVTRPGKWGNPYIVGVKEHDPSGYGLTTVIPKNLSECLSLYEQYIKINHLWFKAHIHEIKGKNLACFCKEGEPCHGDILLRIANE